MTGTDIRDLLQRVDLQVGELQCVAHGLRTYLSRTLSIDSKILDGWNGLVM
jgi:hypothetical protein